MNPVDVIIVGGGIAGSSLAVLLGRAGVQVELFEQHHFPRDKPCAEGLMPAGVEALDRLGIEGTQAGARFRGIRYHGFGQCLTGHFPGGAGVPVWGRALRRLRLDAALFAAAGTTPGVTAREGARVEGPVVESGRVRGIQVAGQIRRARLVVAADGPRSILRRRLGLDRAARGAPRIGVRRHYRLAQGQALPDQVEIFVGGDHEIYVTPLPDQEVSVAALCDRGTVAQAAGSVVRFFERAAAAHPRLQTLLDGAIPVSELGGRIPLASGARRGTLPGLVLLGDAASALDPVTGGGMAQALISAEMLASALVRARPAGGHHPPVAFDPSDDVVEEFDRRRKALYREAAALSALVLALVRHPRIARGAFGLLRRSPGLYTHLLGAAAGTRSLSPI